jgi:hypothetical protein
MRPPLSPGIALALSSCDESTALARPIGLSECDSARGTPTMFKRLDQQVQRLAVAALLFVSIGLCLLCLCWSQSAAKPDDGWRRTEHGWERIASWQSQAMATAKVPVYPAPPAASKPTSRWDTHPAALALVQLAAVLFALLRLPMTQGPRTTTAHSTPIPQRIAKSFRASAFG